MTINTNVVKRPGSSMFYARIGIPPDLQDVMKRKELWKSLGTRDPREARERVLPVLMQWRAQFTELRSRRAPTPEDLQGATWAHYQGELEHDRVARGALPTRASLEA